MSRTSPTVSVVIPTHGRPLFLASALSSIAAQTQSPAEVIVVDDIADGETAALVAARTEGYLAPLRYLHNNRQPGACGSRNVGAAHSTGEVIAFLDDDDLWKPRFLERCTAALAESDIDFVLTDIDRCFPDGSVKRLTTISHLTAANALHQRVHMTGSNFAIRREAFDSVSGFDRDVPVFNDWDLFLRLVRSGKTYEVVPEPLVRWMEHDGARITTATLRRADGIQRFLDVYGADMRYDVRAYFLRIAYGIRKAYEPSKTRKMALTGKMFREAGPVGAAFILWQSVLGRLSPK